MLCHLISFEPAVTQPTLSMHKHACKMGLDAHDLKKMEPGLRKDMCSYSRTTHLLVVGDAPDELIKVPVRRRAKVEMGNYSPNNPGVGLPQPLGTCLNREFSHNILSQEREKVQFNYCDRLVGHHLWKGKPQGVM